MKSLWLILGLVLGLPVVALVLLFVIGSAAGPQEKAKMESPLRNLPSPVVAPDTGGLQSPDVDVRQRAASQMGESASAADCDALLAALAGEREWTVRAAIVTGLGKQFVQSSDVRAKGSDRLLEPLLRELKAPESGLRINAIRSLGWIKDRHAIRSLIPLLDDVDSSVRENTIQALGALGSAEAIPALLKIVRTKSDVNSMERWPRIQATTALANIGDASAVEPLIALLDDPDPTFRGANVRALGRFGDRRATPALRRLLTDDSSDQVRFDVICALAALRDRNALLILKSLASGEGAAVNGQRLNEVAVRAIRFIEKGKGRVNQYE